MFVSIKLKMFWQRRSGFGVIKASSKEIFEQSEQKVTAAHFTANSAQQVNRSVGDLRATVAHRDKTLPRIQNTSQNPKTLSRIQNMFQNPKKTSQNPKHV